MTEHIQQKYNLKQCWLRGVGDRLPFENRQIVLIWLEGGAIAKSHASHQSLIWQIRQMLTNIHRTNIVNACSYCFMWSISVSTCLNKQWMGYICICRRLRIEWAGTEMKKPKGNTSKEVHLLWIFLFWCDVGVCDFIVKPHVGHGHSILRQCSRFVRTNCWNAEKRC